MIDFNIDELDLRNKKDSPECTLLDNNNSFGYSLFREQKQVLHIMNKIEQNEYLISKNNKIYYNKVCLAAPFSFGKTILSCALIKLNNKSVDRLQYSFFDCYRNKDDTLQTSELILLRKKHINTTLVIVSPSTFLQWVMHIDKCNLKALYINTIEELDILLVNIINNNIFDKYDVILLAYRKLTRSYVLPPVKDKNICKLRWYNYQALTNISVISILSVDKLWKRVIIDDFDSINITDDFNIPAKIVWLISTTSNIRKISSLRNMYSTTDCESVVATNHKILDCIKDPFMLSIYSNLSIEIPKIKVKCYIFQYAKTINQVLNSLDYPIEVSEKINSGDISGAATILGLSYKSCNSLGEFLYLMIQKNKKMYIHYIGIYEKISYILQTIEELYQVIVRSVRLETEKVMENFDNPSDFINKLKEEEENNNKWEEYRIKLRRGEEFVTRCEIDDIKTILTKSKESTDKLKNTLDRIKRNMEDNECQKCFCEPEGKKVILQCCNIMLCEDCMLKTNTKNFIDRCPACAKPLDKHSFINVPTNLSLDEFIAIDYNNAFNKLKAFNNTVKDDDREIGEEEEDSELYPKDKALLAILKSKEPTKNIKTVDYYEGLKMSNVLESENILDLSKDTIKKYAVFTRWTNSASHLSRLLTSKKIKNIILRSTNSKTIQREIDKFHYNNDYNILLIPSQEISAGINLPFVTHLIFYHSIRNADTCAQIVGRCQRLGRTSSLEVISLQHEFELNIFNV